MKLGYMAINEQTGEVLKLTGKQSPRQQLLEKLGRKSTRKMYVDLAGGASKHIGYIVAGQWLRVFEVHEWEGGAK